MKVKLEDVERFERHVKMRLAFRFGVITVTDATQAVIRVRISLPDGRTSHGVAAEALAAGRAGWSVDHQRRSRGVAEDR